MKKIIPILFTLLLFLLIYLVGKSIPEATIKELVTKGGVAGPIVFILLTLLTNVVAPLSGSPILLAGYYAFGNNVVFLATAAGLISFITNFWIARKWGRPIVEKLAGKDSMHKVDSLTQNYGLVTLFFFRIFQGGIHDFVSYAFGLTSIRFLPYIVTSFIAVIPGTFFWYYLSLKVNTPLAFMSLTLAIAIVFSAVFFVTTIVLKRWKSRKAK